MRFAGPPTFRHTLLVLVVALRSTTTSALLSCSIGPTVDVCNATEWADVQEAVDNARGGMAARGPVDRIRRVVRLVSAIDWSLAPSTGLNILANYDIEVVGASSGTDAGRTSLDTKALRESKPRMHFLASRAGDICGWKT